MILFFSTKWASSMPNAGKPTQFVEKIWSSITPGNQVTLQQFIDFYNQNHEQIDSYNMQVVKNAHPKLHTIRTDWNGRWQKGTKIHFTINGRTPQQWQFAPVIPVTQVQKIEIKHKDPSGFKLAQPTVHIDGVWLPDPTELALNDGFDSLQDFFSWFNQDFTGKLIHWTNHSYGKPAPQSLKNLPVVATTI